MVNEFEALVKQWELTQPSKRSMYIASQEVARGTSRTTCRLKAPTGST